MVSLTCAVLLVLAAVASGAPPIKTPEYNMKDAPKLFEKFIKDYNRHYKNEADKAAHYKAFVKSLETIIRYNKTHTTSAFGINSFADYTPEELKNLFGLDRPKGGR